ncbi:YciI family protein [Danxiaibacter flavus]|uniref:YciI family protein n=1 Tax=Danxiaibacter flavus TaxID=3049108 RepID=A0ABV3ZCW5_9BACT|nr:YciI family protein [Chitinophagaceae bacterium DXS]
MAEYLLLFRGGKGMDRDQSAQEYQEDMQKWVQWMANLSAQGKLGPAQPLKPEGKVVKGTSKLVTDGPFIEGKEMVGGYLVCKADSYDEAVEIAKQCPILESESGIVEVRSIMEMKM